MEGVNGLRKLQRLHLRKVRIPRVEMVARKRLSKDIEASSSHLWSIIPHWWESKNGEERNWLDLPEDIMLHILNKVGIIDILRKVQMVCSAWRDLSNEPCLFTKIIFPNPSQYFDGYKQFENFIRKVTEKSCGQMIKFHAFEYATPFLLDIISLQSHSLKYLKADDMSFSYLYKYVHHLPQLESLYLRDVWPGILIERNIEHVGYHCPNLKHLGLRFPYDYSEDLENPEFCIDGVAFAIAEYMPNLRSVRLFNDTLSNKGLQAILQGCPQLEYISLRKCLFIDIHDRDWLRDRSIVRNKIIDARVYDEAKGHFDCYLYTKD